jgi:hypothetical protein
MAVTISASLERICAESSTMNTVLGQGVCMETILRAGSQGEIGARPDLA